MSKVKFPVMLAVLGAAAILLTGCPGSRTTAEGETQNTSEVTADTCITTKEPEGGTTAAKPVIYLYPEKRSQISVSLDFDGRLSCSYPEYGSGWTVTADPDGTLINQTDGKEYSYLYWEGVSGTAYDMSRGFVVKGEDTAAFLQEKLAEIGLTPKEYNEFIVYWLPQMQENTYNLITFQDEEYTDAAVLAIVPEPDSILRVFMVYSPLEQYMEIEPQIIPEFFREGFTAVEWGGSCIE